MASTKWAEPPATLAAVCGRCPVRDDCLAMAMADISLTGVWGGTVDRQRAKMRRSLAASQRRSAGQTAKTHDPG